MPYSSASTSGSAFPSNHGDIVEPAKPNTGSTTASNNPGRFTRYHVSGNSHRSSTGPPCDSGNACWPTCWQSSSEQPPAAAATTAGKPASAGHSNRWPNRQPNNAGDERASMRQHEAYASTAATATTAAASPARPAGNDACSSSSAFAAPTACHDDAAASGNDCRHAALWTFRGRRHDARSPDAGSAAAAHGNTATADATAASATAKQGR